MMISVLTIVKNRHQHLEQLVEGLRRSSVSPGELIIVDMGSTPQIEQPELACEVRVVRLETAGLPLAAARNLAASRAKGDRLLFLDVDCIPMQDLVGAMDGALAMHDAMICAQVRYLGPDEGRGVWSEKALINASRLHPDREFPGAGFARIDNPGLFWSLVFGIRRTTFAKLGGFDEAFTGYGGEDTDLGFRARSMQVPLLFTAQGGAFHQHHPTFSPPLPHLEDVVRNAALFRQRWGIWPMAGWLDEFETMGLIERSPDQIRILRLPSAEEVEAACCH
ncbi:glycosyltransferase family 2 protein [Novosphingobium kaempferiae]|uniref:glycosyltransferase family 2 protein n=1 Tax=Novosphingobium kaempferiae TaxID=2896849 RepID=UPI001E5FFAED|nr:glycosyltransferase [Novosphingobium kaempferiae]